METKLTRVLLLLTWAAYSITAGLIVGTIIAWNR